MRVELRAQREQVGEVLVDLLQERVAVLGVERVGHESDTSNIIDQESGLHQVRPDAGICMQHPSVCAAHCTRGRALPRSACCNASHKSKMATLCRQRSRRASFAAKPCVTTALMHTRRRSHFLPNFVFPCDSTACDSTGSTPYFFGTVPYSQSVLSMNN